MSDDTIIRVEGLGKKYIIGHEAERERYVALRDVIARSTKTMLRKATDMVRGRFVVEGDEEEEFWALKDVSFEVKRGEVLGIIGRNGAGKSTLLKILSRITEPTEGRVTIKGRVASLLEVGTGFHPELTGRENIYLNGAILGMTRSEIKRKFDEIVDFAEVEKFLDTPVKRYSSGMYVRLAFAVAAHLEPEILIVDEVLAVGDAEFQKKCLGKMGEVASGGRTVLFVSHNMAAVRALCQECIFVERGEIRNVGNVASVIEQYMGYSEKASSRMWVRSSECNAGIACFMSVAVELLGRQPNHRLRCNITYNITKDCADFFVAADICGSNGTVIMQALPKAHPFLRGKIGAHQIELIVELPPLVPTTYRITFWMGPHNTITYDMVRDVVAIDIVDCPTIGRTFSFSQDHGYIVPQSHCHVRCTEKVGLMGT